MLMMTSLCALCVTSALAAGEPATKYEFRQVDFPGSTGTFLFAVNNLGQFVGAELDAAGVAHAIFNNGTGLRLLDPAGVVGKSSTSQAFSINNRGEIAGEFHDAANAVHGFISHPDGAITQIDFPGGFSTQAFGINDEGTVIGVYNDAANQAHAFVLRDGHYASADLPGGVTTPFSINDREQIVGELVKTQNTNGFGYLQQPDGTFTLTTAPGSLPEGTFFISINNLGQILGAYQSATIPQQNFLETAGNFQLFDLPAQFGAIGLSAQTINDSGEIVGFYVDAGKVNHGFVAIPVRNPR
jgi:probable HAF family extracellular repeat protein